MNESVTQPVKGISFPNTVADRDRSFYQVGSSCDKIEYTMKAGEMAGIAWFQIIKDGQVTAEIKESVCDIYFV